MPMIPRICEMCGVTFAVYPYRLRNGTGGFCSRSCAARDRVERGHLVRRKLPASNVVADEYLAGETARAIAKRYGTTAAAVGWHLKKLGIPIRPNRVSPDAVAASVSAHPRGRSHHAYTEVDVPVIVAAYLRGASTVEIAASVPCSPMTIARKLREAGITIRPPGYRGRPVIITKDGHPAQSGLEQRVDDWLFENGIGHVIHPPLPFGRGMHADFLAANTYIEIWGVTGSARYSARREVKLLGYEQHRLRLIELWPRDVAEAGLPKLHELLG
jgi:hypothetical protein